MSGILPSDTIAQYWCPNLIARLRAAWGGYSSALWVACAVAAAGALAIACLPRHRAPLPEESPDDRAARAVAP
jgi:hypothetical protein